MKTVFASLLVVAGVTVNSAPAFAASAIQTANCPSGQCAQFGSADTIPLIKSFTFTNPAANGSATVTFSGSLFCAAAGSPLQDRVIDLTAAITDSPSGAIAATTPSFLRHAHVLKDEADHNFDSSTSFNLQTTRVFTYPTAGSRNTVYFRIVRARQDAGVTCYVTGGSFSVIRTP